MRETLEQKKRRGAEIVRRLREEFPEPECALTHDGPFQLLIATILSAQCTDVRVNLVTPALFAAAPDAATMAKLGERKIRTLIKSINFAPTKAKNILATARLLIKHHDGQVPANMDALTALPGVGRKTANVVLGNAFHVPGVVVDTHVRRLANRMELTRHDDPVDIEHDLEKLFVPEEWVDLSHLLILHGRKTCAARKPQCPTCRVNKFCPSAFKEL